MLYNCSKFKISDYLNCILIWISDIKKLKKWNVICDDDILKTVTSDSSSDDSMSTDDSSSESDASDASSSDGQMDTDWFKMLPLWK